LHIKIDTEIEHYDNTDINCLIKISRQTVKRESKRFIKDKSQIESEIIKYIESLTNEDFDPLMAESHAQSSLSLTYHYPQDEKHIMFHICIKLNEQKIEFED